MFIRKYWIPISVFIVALVGVSLYYLQTRPPKKPVLIVTPVEVEKLPAKVPVGDTSQNGHFHADGTWHAEPHARISETQARALPDRDTDWREDPAFDDTLVKKDPWKQTYPQQASTDDTDDTYPPRDWYKTEDPELHAEYFYAQLLKQFGDIPEVHIIAEHNLQIAKKVPITVDQWIKYLEASQVLWPNQKNAELLETLQKDKVEEHQ